MELKLGGQNYVPNDAFARKIQAEAKKIIQQARPWRLELVLWRNLLIGLIFFLTPIVLMCLNFLNWWLVPVYILSLGEGFVWIGTSQHHGSHGAFAAVGSKKRKKKINSFVAHLILVVGLWIDNWMTEHVVLHHGNTNIYGKDADLGSGESAGLAFSVYTKLTKPFRQRNRWWVKLLYALTFVSWIWIADDRRLRRYYGYHGRALVRKDKTLSWHLWRLWGYKICYFLVIIGLPIFLGSTWYLVLITWLGCWVYAGLDLMPVFQAAHCTSLVKHHDGQVAEKEKVSFSRHAIETTANFHWPGIWGKVLSHKYGMLTHQIEHHIWPTVSPVLYSVLAKMVKKEVDIWNQDHPDDQILYQDLLYKEAKEAHFKHVEQIPLIKAAEFQTVA